MPPTAKLEDYLDLIAAVEDTAADLELPVRDRGLHAADRSPHPEFQDHARPRRHRGQPASRRQLVGAGRQHRDALRGGAPMRSRRGEVPARWTACRHGRRATTSSSAGRTPTDSPHPAPARSAAQPARLLAESSVALLPLFRDVHRPDQPVAAHRRGAQRRALRAAARLRAGARFRPHPAVAGRPHLPPSSHRRDPATRTAPSSASTSFSRRTARPAGWACWNCAPSRCRRMRA